MFLLLSVEEIRKANFGIYVLCYAQTSPLAVSTYSFGTSCGLPFDNSALFLKPLVGRDKAALNAKRVKCVINLLL